MVMIPNSARMGDMPKGEPLPEGVYQLRLEKAVYKTSKEKGTPMAEVTFVHVLPALRVICTCPSFVPAQINPGAIGDSAIA